MFEIIVIPNKINSYIVEQRLRKLKLHEFTSAAFNVSISWKKLNLS